MADFTDQEKELLDKLRKAFEAKGKTRLALEPWQEHIDRDATVNLSRAGMAAKALEGFAGSWAAQYNYSWGSRVAPDMPASPPEAVEAIDPLGPPVPIRSKINHLGQRGLPEVNFVPYNWRTNTFGSKGGALVGHTISFEVVGPTLKSPHCDWTWNITQGGGPNGGDVLSVGPRPDGTPTPVLNDIIDMYGPRSTDVPGFLWTIGDDAEPNGGLYLLVSDDGTGPGSLDTGGGQVAMSALDFYVDTARFELFRISEVTETTIEVHPSKSFSEFFDLPLAGTRSVRAITLVRPYVTRLAAIPQSGAAGGNDGVSVSGREQVFVTVSPELAAGNDNFPPYDGGNGAGSGDGSWIGGGFTDARAPFGSPIGGAPDAYGGRVRLPVPIPVREDLAEVETSLLAPGALVGNWILEVPDATPYTAGPLFSSRLPVVRISATSRNDDTSDLTLGSIPNVLGWFDAVATTVAPDTVTLARVPETDPQTGLTYWGPGPWESNVGDPNVAVGLTFHEAVEALWYGPFALDKVEASRLKNLIDPTWVQRFEKQISDPLLVSGMAPPPGGGTAGRPDRAIFDTRRFFGAGPLPDVADPGNLMDLGFRMVLFPAKEDPNDATQAIPDFDNPILGRELTIDGSNTTEKQYVEIDYSSGIVRLSIPPPTSRSGVPDFPSDVIPNGIQGTAGNNPRGEVVLFGACVPYSMEESQLGTGARVTANAGDGHRDFDLYSDQVLAKMIFATDVAGTTTFVGASPFIGPAAVAGGDVAIILDRIWDGPETGVVTITAGSDSSLTFGKWGYTERRTVLVAGLQKTALVGISALSGSANPDPALHAGEQTRAVILRREAVFDRQSFALPFVTDFYPGDTTYGSEARAQAMRFERARLLPELDGSVTVRPRPDLAAQLDRVEGAVQPALSLHPYEPVYNPVAPFDAYFSETGVFQGLLYNSQLGDLRGTNPGLLYRNLGAPEDGGPHMRFGLRDLPPAWHGILTGDGGTAGQGRLSMSSNLRFVAKMGAEIETLAEATGFVGLIQDETGPGLTPTVATISDPGLLPPLHTVVGFQFDTRVATVWRFWTRGAAGGDSLIPIPGATADRALGDGVVQGPYYFVIETNLVPGAGFNSLIVKLGAYDRNKTLLSSITVNNTALLPASGGRGLFMGAALRENTAPDLNTELLCWFIHVTTDGDRDDLPPLP